MAEIRETPTPFSPFGTAPPGSPATIPSLVVAAVWGPWIALGLAWAGVMQAASAEAIGRAVGQKEKGR